MKKLPILLLASLFTLVSCQTNAEKTWANLDATYPTIILCDSYKTKFKPIEILKNDLNLTEDEILLLTEALYLPYKGRKVENASEGTVLLIEDFKKKQVAVLNIYKGYVKIGPKGFQNLNLPNTYWYSVQEIKKKP